MVSLQVLLIIRNSQDINLPITGYSDVSLNVSTGVEKARKRRLNLERLIADSITL
ncbi:hypothetical protein [Legionella fairfieldensis]|uniref:hypothetical protein n=1 Tax=Legionella fairfieldensis TaxID=45064 RepID=UPI000A522C30|nr:hypothetical protein [Legionella fairfieldensis]